MKTSWLKVSLRVGKKKKGDESKLVCRIHLPYHDACMNAPF